MWFFLVRYTIGAFFAEAKKGPLITCLIKPINPCNKTSLCKKAGCCIRLHPDKIALINSIADLCSEYQQYEQATNDDSEDEVEIIDQEELYADIKAKESDEAD